MYNFVILITSISIFFTSCCTITRTNSQIVSISSKPDNADITINGYNCGTTPQAFQLSRKIDHEIILEKEGFQKQCFLIKSKTSPKILSNALIPVGTGLLAAGAAMIACGGTHIIGFALVLVVFVAAGIIIGTVGGAVGAGIDCLSGSAYHLSHDQIHADFREITP